MFWQMVNLFCKNYETLLTTGIIMASMLIVLIGCFKPLYNKISNKHIRGFALSLTNVISAFLFVAVAFWTKGISFKYYWFTAIVFCCLCIVIYWAYENLTQARAGIHKLGSFVWKRLAPIIRNKLDNIILGLNDTKNLTKMVDNFVATGSKKSTKKNTSGNKDIKNL
jgi:peptidoglycan/LPS O-acetylase OafA/YrhL